MAQSIGEIWARSVNDKTQTPKVDDFKPELQTTPVKPVTDKETESRKAQFRQNILKQSTQQKEQPNG